MPVEKLKEMFREGYNKNKPDYSNRDHQRRQRFRPWLISKIDSRKFPGLDWVDKTQLIFRVPWKHGGKQDWSERNSLIFKEWALHTGRYRKGIDKEEWPTWKTRFRCALNKLSDIEEIKEKSRLDGDDPFRVYKFLPTVIKSRSSPENDRYNNNHNIIKTEVPCYQRSPENTQTINLPQTVMELEYTGEQTEVKTDPALTSDDLGVINIDDLVGMKTPKGLDLVIKQESSFEKEEDMITDDCLITDTKFYPTDTMSGAPLTMLTSRGPYLNLMVPQNREPSNYEMIIRLQFRTQVVAQHHITKPNGIQLHYGPLANYLMSDIHNKVYGSCEVDLIQFPLSKIIDNEDQREITDGLLNKLDRGIILKCTSDGDIYITRQCRVVVFAATPNSKPQKIERNGVSHKIFDYNQFKLDLDNYANDKGSRPSAQVLLGFGQTWTNTLEPYANLLITTTIYHPKAIYELSKVSGQGILSPPVQISDSDEMDQYIQVYKEFTSNLPCT